MLSDSPPVCFILTADIAKARAFYSGTLGLREVAEDPFAVTYDLVGTALRLTSVGGHRPGPHTVLGWTVTDIDAAVDALAAKGVACLVYEGFGQDARGIWTEPNSETKVAWFNDPEGNNLSITQPGG